jgi:hypothetical protein
MTDGLREFAWLALYVPVLLAVVVALIAREEG